MGGAQDKFRPQNEMWDSSTCCMGNKDCSSRKFQVNAIDAKIDDVQTIIDESSSCVIKYCTPHFRAWGDIHIAPLTSEDFWQIGWIQACDHMYFVNTYGKDGTTSWEFPELTSGKQPMISDCDGKHFPWYGPRNEVQTITGPTHSNKNIRVSMTDNFFPQVTWCIPLSPTKTAKLTHIKREQSFYVWLVAKNLVANKIYVLKTVRWKAKIEISVDCDKPIGQRAKLLHPYKQKQPKILKRNVPIPSCALHEPNANSAQTLIWRGKSGSQTTVVPPRSKIIICPVECDICKTDSIHVECSSPRE